jgi:AcrR family transcriptional regulator
VLYLETFSTETVSVVFSLYKMREETKRILEKVHCLYARYGIKSVTMDDVAKELGISKKTLYHHVKDKSDLVEKVLDLEFSNRAGEMSKIREMGLNAIEELFEVNRLINMMLKRVNPSMEHDLMKYFPDLYDKISKERKQRMFQSMIENIKKGKEEGLYRLELNEKIISKLYVTRFENAFHDDVQAISNFTSEEFISEVFIYHIRGIANKSGIQFLEANKKSLMKKVKEM